eukprot:8416-Prymnesium_polylepis.1
MCGADGGSRHVWRARVESQRCPCPCPCVSELPIRGCMWRAGGWRCGGRRRSDRRSPVGSSRPIRRARGAGK